MRTLLKLLQHNIWYKVIVSLKKWHYEKNLHTTVSFLHTQLFFLEIYFFKNEFIQSQNEQKNEEKKNFYQDSIFFSLLKEKTVLL